MGENRSLSYLVDFSNKILSNKDQVSATPDFITLGMINTRQILPPGLAALHTMLWKFFLIAFVKVDTENAKFEPENIWKAAVGRLQRKIEARIAHLRDRTQTAVCLGNNPQPLTSERTTPPPWLSLNLRTIRPSATHITRNTLNFLIV